MRVSTALMHKQGTESMLRQQSETLKTQMQIASGKRILTPSDDPSGAAKVLDLQQAVGVIERYQNNIGDVESRLALEESVLDGVNDIAISMKELAIQGANGTQSPESIRGISAVVEEHVKSLLQMANTTDGNEYLFAGYKSKTTPFSEAAGVYTYNGDQGVRMTQVGPSRHIAETDSGYEVFMDIKDGNGTYTTAPAAGNTGTGVVTVGTVTNSAAWVPDTYSVTFAEAAGVTTYTVTDSLGATVGVADTPFTDGDAIAFNGIEFNIKGDPADTDTFTIDESSNQSMFETFKALVDVLKMPQESPEDGAKFQSAMGKVMKELDLALDNTNTVLAEVGARMNAVDTEYEANAGAVLTLKQNLSSVQDLDMAEAITRFDIQVISLQAAQQSFAKMQGLSLFNYL